MVASPRLRQVIPERGVVRITWHILEFYTPEISLQWLKLETSNFVHEVATWCISLLMTNCPPSGRGQNHVTHFRFLHPLKYLWNGCSWRLQISYTTWPREVLALPCWLSPKWACSGLRDSFLHFGAQAIFLERMTLDISNLVCRLNIKTAGITHVKVLQHGVHLRSRDLLKFWEISANISKTVQDRHIVTNEG